MLLLVFNNIFLVIEIGSKNIPAYQFKLVALIKLGLFDEALKLIAEIPAKQLGYVILRFT
jgi:hypothetical protein